MQRDAAVGRDERAVDRLGIVCRRIRSGEDDVPAHGRRDVLEQSQRGGGTIAIGVDDDVAGRGQRGGVEGVDTVAAARNGCATVAVTGKKNATDRRSAAGRNRTLQGKPRDAAADDTHITQRRSDGADNSRARGADHSVDARGADDDIAVGRQRSDRRRGEAVGLAAGAGGPRSRRGDPADERGALDGDTPVRGGDRTIEVKAVVRARAGRMGGEHDVPRDGRADEIIDDDGVAGQGGVARHRDRTRGTQLAGGGAVDAITAAARPGDGQRTEVAARAGAYLTGDVHAVGTATEEGDIAVGRDDVTGDAIAEIGDAVTGEPDIARGQQVARPRRREALAGTRGRRTRHRRSDAADQARALDDEITARDRHRVGEIGPGRIDVGIGAARMARKDDVAGDGRRERRTDVKAVVSHIGIAGQRDRPGRADRGAGGHGGAARGGAGDRERADEARAADGDRPEQVHTVDAFAAEDNVAAGGRDRPLGVDARIAGRIRGDIDITAGVQRSSRGQ